MRPIKTIRSHGLQRGVRTCAGRRLQHRRRIRRHASHPARRREPVPGPACAESRGVSRPGGTARKDPARGAVDPVAEGGVLAAVRAAVRHADSRNPGLHPRAGPDRPGRAGDEWPRRGGAVGARQRCRQGRASGSLSTRCGFAIATNLAHPARPQAIADFIRTDSHARSEPLPAVARRFGLNDAGVDQRPPVSRCAERPKRLRNASHRDRVGQ